METIDKLTFAIDGDLTLFKAKAAEAEVIARRTGAAISTSLGKGMQDAAGPAAAGATKVAQALGDVEKATRATHGSTATATREFRALFDELSSGRTRQTPGTLAIIATRVFGVSGATLAWGAAIAAIPAAFAIAAAKAEESLGRIRAAIALTRNASGLTPSSISAITSQLVATGQFSTMGAQSAIAGFAGGMVPSRFIGQAATAASNYSLASGTSADDARKLLIQMFQDPAKSAQELHQQFGLLTAAQMRQVEQLQRSGDTERAAQIVLVEFSGRADDAAKSAGFLSKALDKATTAAGGIASYLAKVVGAEADVEKLADLRTRLAFMQQHGMGGSLQAKDIGNQITILQDRVLNDNAATARGDLAKKRQDAILAGMGLVDKETGSFAAHLTALDDQIKMMNRAVDAARDTHSKYTADLIKQRDALVTARAHQLDPAQEAALRAREQARINAASPANRGRISAEVDAQRQLRENLANPAMAPYAQAIYRAQLATATGERYSAEGNRQAKNLAAMQAEAQGAMDVAKALEISAAAGEEARIRGEAHAAFVKQEIANETAYANALRERAFYQERANVLTGIQSARLSNLGLAGIAAAGGNPAAIADARRQNEARQQLAPEFARAGSNQALIALANADLKALVEELKKRDVTNAIIEGNASTFGGQQRLGNLSATARAFGAGAGPDELRHLDVMQKSFDELVNRGLDPTTEEFKRQLDILVPLNERLSDLQDALDKAQKAAQDYASDITGPLKSFLTGGGSFKDMAANIGQNLLGTLVQTNIIDPLQKNLTGMFSSLLGVPGLSKADGSLTNPYFVVPMGGGLGGGGGAGGIVQSLLSIFGGGKAGGGPTRPGQFYLVGENGPELFAPGAGNVVPLNPPRAGTAIGSGSSDRMSTGGDNFNFNFYGPTDKRDVLAARSQMEALVTRMAARGRRNT